VKYFRFVLERCRETRGLLIGSFLAGIVSGTASVALLTLINHTLRGGGKLPGLVWLFLGLCAVVTVTRVASHYLLVRMGQDMVVELRLELSDRILATPLARLEEVGAHPLLATMTEDINSLASAMIYVPVVAINGAIVLGCFLYLGWLNPGLALILVAAVIFGAITYQLPARLGNRKLREARQQDDHLFAHFRSLTEGIKELKLHRKRRQAFRRLLEGTAHLLRRLRVAGSIIYGSATAWGHLLMFVFIGLLLYARPSFIAAGPETLMSYTVVILYMMAPLQAFLDAIPTLGRAKVAVDRVEELGLNLALDLDASAEPLPRAAGWDRLDLRSVTYTYRREGQDRNFTLGPIDLTLRPGEAVFLVGGNGSGKTSLAKLLVGLYSPESGEVRLDDRPVLDQQRDDYRQLFSAVFSDFYLFERLLGLEASAVDLRAKHYLKELRIDHKVEVRDGKLSTLDLSLGQRKRLALLVAYLEDRPIYVFDEWAADQDPVFKEVFYRQILAELKQRGKAVVVISHDDRYFHLADRLIKLEDGRISCEGPHEGQSPLEVRAS
jgi:putative ATP-binding cassette transporter